MGIMGSLIFIIKKRARRREGNGSGSPQPGAVGSPRERAAGGFAAGGRGSPAGNSLKYFLHRQVMQGTPSA